MKRKCKHVYYPEFLHSDGKTTGHCEKCGIPMWRKIKTTSNKNQDEETHREKDKI